MSENGAAAAPGAPTGRGPGFGAGLFVAAAGIAALAVLLGVRVAADGPVGEHWWLVAFIAVGLVDTVVGLALVNRIPERRLAWCLVVSGVAAVVAVVLATSPGAYSATIERAPGWERLRDTGSWAEPLATGVLAALVPWELASNGRRRGFEAIWWTTAALVAATVVGEVAGGRSPGVDVFDVATWLVTASAVVATTLLLTDWWRQRAGTDDPLQGWIAAGAVVACLAVLADRLGIDRSGVPAVDVVGPLLLLATLPLLVVGLIVRAMRERPGRFQGVAHDVIGWLVLSAAIVVLYTAVVAGLGRLLGGSDPAWLLVVATVAIAISVEPARHRLRTTVDRLVWGTRDDPLEVVRNVVDHVGADSDGELLPALARSLREELRFDAVAIDVKTPDRWRRAAAAGPPTTHERVVELDQHGTVVGRLVVGWEDGPHLRVRDEHVLRELAGPVGLAVAWVRLAEDLRRSTIAVASTREEERHRLRRDLHDGLGPALTGVSLGLRAAQRHLERPADPVAVAASRDLVERSADEVDALVVEVKRIVRALRPSVLDQLGLVEAVRSFTRGLGDDLRFHLTLPERSVELPAAVEVAIYRIVTEAVTNVVRHASATQCWMRIAIGDAIEVEIVDDGVGIDDLDSAGVGWTAMRERASELGGSVEVSRRDPHGTRVLVELPAVAR